MVWEDFYAIVKRTNLPRNSQWG